jgi:SRSO17 transposase
MTVAELPRPDRAEPARLFPDRAEAVKIDRSAAAENGWALAEEAGHAGPDRIQRMLNRIDWDADEVLDDVRQYVVDHFGDRHAVLIVDDTGFLKKGAVREAARRRCRGPGR